jgi:hypothetical protein
MKCNNLEDMGDASRMDGCTAAEGSELRGVREARRLEIGARTEEDRESREDDDNGIGAIATDLVVALDSTVSLRLP